VPDSVTFDLRPITGKLAEGDLGSASLFIDPTGPASNYSVTVTNNSTTFTNLAVYQTLGGYTPDQLPLVWLSRPSAPSTDTTFNWDTSYQVYWAQTGGINVGIYVEPNQMLLLGPANPFASPGNGIVLTNQNSVPQFANPVLGQFPAGTVGIACDATIPPGGQLAIGYAQSGAPAYVAPTAPNYQTTFDVSSATYWLVAGSFYNAGEAINPTTISNAIQLKFPPGVYSLHATLNADGTRTIATT
jgi:hypothetical protein